MAYKLEVRKVDNTIGETGTADRTETEYQFGTEIDGVFIPFVSKSGGYIDHLVSQGQAAQAQEKKNKPTPEPTPAADEPTTDE